MTTVTVVPGTAVPMTRGRPLLLASTGSAGATVSMVSDSETGWSLRYVKQYNAQTDQKISRLDCFYGWLAYRPEWAVAVQGGAS